MHDTFNACEWLLDRHITEGRGGHTAVRCQGESVSYAEVLELTEAVATGLRRLGLRPEERVALVMLDSVEYVATFLAALRIGAVPVLTNPLLPGRDLGVIIADSRARMIVASDERSSSIPDLCEGAPEVEHVVTTSGNSGTVSWADFTESTDDGGLHRTWAESPGFWLCTSGTTGMPKLAMHRHGDLLAAFEAYARNVLNVTKADRFYSVGPMFHAYGLCNSVTYPFAVGATSILEPTRPPTPQLVAEIVSTEKPTLFFCIPTFLAALNNADIAGDTFCSVRYGISAAEPLPAETFERFRERYGVTVLDGIGSTELLHIFLSNTPEHCRPGTSGVPVPGYEARIVDEEGNDQPDNELGQLLVRGESAATGYWCRTEMNRSTFQGDWIRTGDLYVRSNDGYYTYLGRADDMMRIGGEWVSPAEVEATLIENETVLEAAVVGERDVGDILRAVAYVVPTPDTEVDPDELTEWCRERLAGYKRPRRYEVVTDLPKTTTGKIQRYKLRSACWQSTSG